MRWSKTRPSATKDENCDTKAFVCTRVANNGPKKLIFFSKHLLCQAQIDSARFDHRNDERTNEMKQRSFETFETKNFPSSSRFLCRFLANVRISLNRAIFSHISLSICYRFFVYRLWFHCLLSFQFICAAMYVFFCLAALLVAILTHNRRTLHNYHPIGETIKRFVCATEKKRRKKNARYLARVRLNRTQNNRSEK